MKKDLSFKKTNSYDSDGNIINPAKEDGNLFTATQELISIDDTTDDIYLRMADGVQATRIVDSGGSTNATGEVQATPTANTILGRLKDIWDRLLDKTQFTKITDGTNDMTVNSEGRADVVQHAHVDAGTIHFFASGLTVSEDFILIDLSDTTNYPHVDTNYIHIEWVHIQVLGSATPAADYQVGVGYITNVDATDGDFYHVDHVDGNRVLGTSQLLSYVPYPNGFRCRIASHTTGHKSLDDVAFQTDAGNHLATTLDPTSADTPSGDGDLILRTAIADGTLDVITTIGYHTH